MTGGRLSERGVVKRGRGGGRLLGAAEPPDARVLARTRRKVSLDWLASSTSLSALLSFATPSKPPLFDSVSSGSFCLVPPSDSRSLFHISSTLPAWPSAELRHRPRAHDVARAAATHLGLRRPMAGPRRPVGGGHCGEGQGAQTGESAAFAGSGGGSSSVSLERRWLNSIATGPVAERGGERQAP